LIINLFDFDQSIELVKVDSVEIFNICLVHHILLYDKKKNDSKDKMMKMNT